MKNVTRTITFIDTQLIIYVLVVVRLVARGDFVVVAGCRRAELGTRQPCRDNLTILSGHKMVDYCLMSIFAMETFSYFSCP